MIKGIDHIVLAVDDLEAVSAYFIAFGAEIIERSDHAGQTIILRLPGDNQPVIELTPTHRPDGQVFAAGLRHIAFKTDDIDAVHASLTKQGVPVEGLPKMSRGRRLLNTYDPSGMPSVQVVD